MKLMSQTAKLICFIWMGSLLQSGCGSGAAAPPPPVLGIATASLADGFATFPYSQTIVAVNGVAPFSWTIVSGDLPQKLFLASSAVSSVIVSGTPAVAQLAQFTIQVSNAKGQTATHSYTLNINGVSSARLQEVQGQVPTGIVEIQALSAGLFNLTYWQAGTLNLLSDVRVPMLPPQDTSPYQNIYAPSALEQPAGWRLFYGGWDGSDTPNDRVSSVTTEDFLSFENRVLVIDHGAFVHVNNVNVQSLSDGSLHMICTVAPDQFNLNKPAYFSSPDGSTWNGAPQPYEAQLSDIIDIQNYPKFQNGDFNGANVLLRDNNQWTLYFSNWNDQGQTGTLHIATTDSPPEFQLQGSIVNTIHAVQDVKIFQEGGKNWYLMGLDDNTSSLWYSLSSDGVNFSKEKILFPSLASGEDQFIVSLGFVTKGNQLLGIVYGAGAASTLDQNRLFARWLRKKIVITDSSGVNYSPQGGYGPDRQWFLAPSVGLSARDHRCLC
jgi:Putative Ig domain